VYTKASTEKRYPITVNHADSGRDILVRLASSPMPVQVPITDVSEDRNESGRTEHFNARLMNLPFGTPNEQAMDYLFLLEPSGTWQAATPRHMAAYILEHGVHQAGVDVTDPDFYLVGLGLHPTVFTNVDPEAVMPYLSFTAVVPGHNDYGWMQPPDQDSPPRDRFYLAVQPA
jgi:hypothetical protein